MLYLTPSRYRTMGFGADLDEVDDSQLSMQLRLASGLVNRYCNRPSSYDFRGGLVTNEKHPWRIGNGNAPGSTGIFPKLKPVLDVSSFNIYVTNTQYLNISDQYINIGVGNQISPVVAATSIGVWSYSAVPVAGFVEPEARITYTYGYFHTDEGEELYPEGAGVYRAANQWWADEDVFVYKNGTLLTETTDYTINYDEGFIDLSEDAQDDMDPDDVITVDYTHRLPENVRDAVGVVATDLLGAVNIVGAGLQGLSRIKAEEIELAQDGRSSIVTGELNGRAQLLLADLREYHWG